MYDRHRRIVGFISVALLAFATPALAQLRGKVIDEQGRPVAGATIEVTSVSESVVGFVVQQKPSAGSIQVESTRDLNATFRQILGEFRRRYLISYSPQGVMAGGWHRLDVRVKGRNLTVRARPGY